MLDCCTPHDIVKAKGITLSKLSCLAKCNGAEVKLRFAANTSMQEFRDEIASVCTTSTSTSSGEDSARVDEQSPDKSNSGRKVVIVSYCRPVLNQTGSGHFSPIGGVS